jgi:hypothetical protein
LGKNRTGQSGTTGLFPDLLLSHIGANVNVESITVIPAQNIILGKLAFAGKIRGQI